MLKNKLIVSAGDPPLSVWILHLLYRNVSNCTFSFSLPRIQQVWCLILSSKHKFVLARRIYYVCNDKYQLCTIVQISWTSFLKVKTAMLSSECKLFKNSPNYQGFFVIHITRNHNYFGMTRYIFKESAWREPGLTNTAPIAPTAHSQWVGRFLPIHEYVQKNLKKHLHFDHIW